METMSLDLDALEVFVRVAELGSFTQAAQQPGMPKKARASAHLKRAPGFLAEAGEITALFHTLWTFVDVPGQEPTNNSPRTAGP